MSEKWLDDFMELETVAMYCFTRYLKSLHCESNVSNAREAQAEVELFIIN